MAKELLTSYGISKEEEEECKKLYEKGGIEALRAYLLEKANEWKKIPLNIGIIGNSGVGKSCFINTIRGLTGDDDGAAKVGVVETTVKPTPYAHPNNELLKFWDLPGVGTPMFPKEGYLENIGFAKFDFFLVITNIRFTENDKWLANKIAIEKKRFFFVRTKIHCDILNDKDDHPRTHNAKAVLIRIRDNIRENLGNLYVDREVFLIDNHKRKMYDFDNLEQRIIEEYPSVKQKAFILSIGIMSENMVRMKAQTLRESIWMSCVVSGAIALVPIPGTSIVVDTALILSNSKFYFHQLGLDKKSLERTAKMLSCDIDKLQRAVKQPILSLLTMEGILIFIRTIPWATVGFLVEEGLRFIPIIGWLISATISFKTTHYILNEILKKMEETALLVMDLAVKNSLDNDSDN